MGVIMETKITSTVSFRSNLQPIYGSIREDLNFLASIHDPFALEMMRKMGYEAITPIQRKEFEDASLHCAYAYKDDYPWGTIVDLEGKQKVVCKCTNTSCEFFENCRPDFDSDELVVEKENEHFQKKAQEILTAIGNEAKTGEQERETGDAIAATLLFKGDKILRDEIIDEGDTETTLTQTVSVATELEKQFLDKTVDTTTASFNSFTEVEQTDIIELNPEERTVVNAGPGTGKTWTLIEKIKYMLSIENVEPENILVLCFSRTAVKVVRTRLENAADKDELPLNWHEIDVRTFDSFATYLLAWLQENKPDVLPNGFMLEFANYEQRIIAAVSAIKKFTDLLVEYQHIFVDEVQDLVGARAEMVLALLRNLPETCGFTLLGDSCQSLYDYLAVDNNTVMDSNRFYETIFQTYPAANYYSLTHNYRQGDEFGTITLPYRNSILTGASTDRAEEARKLTAMIVSSNVNLKRFSNDDVARFKKSGALGILTRTNGQALQISSWLRTEGIDHTLQKPLNSQEFAPWIYSVLTEAETDVIDLGEFTEIFTRIYPEKSTLVDHYWNALLSTQRDQTKRHYEIEDFLRGLMQNARNTLLYEEPLSKNSDITVSNIHRAKGREFDSVLVLEDVLEEMTDEEADDVLEHKVCYVALTRPKKKIEKVSLATQYIYISKDESRRCFKAGGRPGHNYLSHFEIEDSVDVNMRSLAADNDIQSYIKKLPIDTRLLFLRCPEKTKSYVIYKIVPEEDEHMVLGYTTASFARDIEKAIQRIYKNNRPVPYSYYPEIFSDVYFNGLYTCISASDVGIGGAKKFGDMYTWYGIDISGFAHRETTRY